MRSLTGRRTESKLQSRLMRARANEAIAAQGQSATGIVCEPPSPPGGVHTKHDTVQSSNSSAAPISRPRPRLTASLLATQRRVPRRDSTLGLVQEIGRAHV